MNTTFQPWKTPEMLVSLIDEVDMFGFEENRQSAPWRFKSAFENGYADAATIGRNLVRMEFDEAYKMGCEQADHDAESQARWEYEREIEWEEAQRLADDY